MPSLSSCSIQSSSPISKNGHGRDLNRNGWCVSTCLQSHNTPSTNPPGMHRRNTLFATWKSWHFSWSLHVLFPAGTSRYSKTSQTQPGTATKMTSQGASSPCRSEAAAFLGTDSLGLGGGHPYRRGTMKFAGPAWQGFLHAKKRHLRF